MSTNETVHGTAISIDGSGILLLGKSGSGKSDLALRLIDRGATLISDDAVIIKKHDAGPMLHAASNIEGRIEMRGVGIVARPFVSPVPLKLVLLLGERVERLPSYESYRVVGANIPVLKLDAFQASAPIKVEQRLQRIVDVSHIQMAEAAKAP